MAFITKEDFGGSIRNNVLDDITGFDDNKIDKAISYAVKYAQGHLNARYDVEEIFSATGSDRDEVILRNCVDIAIYKLHDDINPRKTPERRKNNYEDALMWFDQVKEGKINPPGLPVPEDGGKDYVDYGGNTKRINHI